MSNYGLSSARDLRAKFAAAMEKIAVGAKVANYNGGRYQWTITAAKHYDGSARLTLRCGRRTVQALVPIVITGPSLAAAGLRSVAPAPRQVQIGGLGNE